MADDKKLIDEQNVYIKDTLLSIAANYAEVLKDAVESAFDGVDAGVLKAVGNDLTRSFTKLAKLSDEFALNTSKIKKGLISQKDIEKQIQSIQEKRELLERKIQHSKALGVKISEEDHVLALESLDLQEQQLEIDKKLAESQSFRIGIQKGFNNLQKTFNTEQLLNTFTIAGLFGLIVKGALDFNKYSVATGKALGYSSEKANDLQSNFNNIARSTTDVNISNKSLNEAFGQLAQSTGLVYEYSEDTLKTQIKLTKVVGLQADEAAQIQRYSALTNTSSSQVYDSFVKGLVAQRNQSRIGINFKETLAESVKVSGRLAANLGYNPERIAKAVVQAKAFGMTLEQTSKIGDSLLDFGSSIENELKAELLTGKQLNLERARAAALSGDQATLAEEISKNVGTAADFAKMNVLQQKALAEATGMTSDELSETLRKREEALKSGKSLAQVTEDDAKKAIERQDIQTKFNAGIEKLQSLIGGILAGPLGGFLDVLTKSLDVITIIAGVFGTIYTIMKATTILESLKLGYSVAAAAAKTEELTAESALNIAKGEELATQIGIAAAWAIANPLTALAGLAIAAGVGGLVYSQMKDGVIGPGGETMVSGPKGSIQLDKNDSLIAGTNLFRGDDVLSLPKNALSVGGGNSALLEAISGLRNDLQNPKPIMVNNVINNNIERAGTAMYGYSYKAP